MNGLEMFKNTQCCVNYVFKVLCMIYTCNLSVRNCLALNIFNSFLTPFIKILISRIENQFKAVQRLTLDGKRNITSPVFRLAISEEN